MHRDPDLPGTMRSQSLRTNASPVIAIAVCLILVALIFGPTTLSMIEIWNRSETFQHCFAVVPIALWLVWREREQLAATPLRPFWPGLALVAGFGGMWLLGVLGAAQVVAQFAVVGAAVAAVLTVFGTRWARLIWFPLLFLFFAVPFGEFLVPRLIDWTADFTVAALRVTGVPVYREGTNFVIPTGNWSVVEACSGIRYLIASLMSGLLYAWLMYRTTGRRIAFVLAAIAVPIVANWLRAYGIVMLGHLSGNKLATGVDHLVYGWLFFGVVMLALFWLGSFWRETDMSEPAAGRLAATSALRWQPVVGTLAGALVLLAAYPAVAVLLERAADTRPVGAVDIQPGRGWSLASRPVSTWRPKLEGPAREQVLSFSKGDRTVTLYLGIYRNQSQGSELVNSQNVLVTPDDRRWKLIASSRTTLADALGPFPANTGLVRGAEGTFAVVQWYWLGTIRTTSDAQAKLDLALDRLLLRGDTSAWVALHARAADGSANVQPVLQEFLRDMGGTIDAALNEMSRR
jgi:exosortase A